MPHDTALIFTLAAGFGLAFVLGMAAERLRLPPLVGYLLAGIALGPFTPGMTVDTGLAAQLAEVGVVLLMFGVGLHFSMTDLFAVRRVAVPGALLRIAIVSGLTAVVARAWGWSWGGGVVLGLALSVASTVVVLRQLEVLGILDSSDGRVAVGWLVVEDVAMVLALVLLPPLTSGGGATSGLALDLTITLLKVAAFVVLMLFVGTRTVPWLLGHVARTGSRELFTLAVLAAALGIAVGAAALFGVSFALGAFFAGVVIAESDLSQQAAADALPLQDAFAVLFFVSVGMLFDPTVVVREPVRVLTVVALVVVVKAVVTFALTLFLRRPIRSSLIISASLAQIGEFSFILAGLGIALGALPAEGRDLILAGALISTILNPLLLRSVNGIEHWFEARPKLVGALERSDAEVDVEGPESADALRDHVVLIGYGRVGRRIGDALRRAEIPFVAVDRDRVTVEALRKEGVLAVFGDAARHGILDHVHLETARLLVVASPDPYQSRRVIELARQASPEIEIAVRTHSEGGESYLRERGGVIRAFMGERELALSMSHYALVRMGRTDDEADNTIEAMRRATSLRLHVPTE